MAATRRVLSPWNLLKIENFAISGHCAGFAAPSWPNLYPQGLDSNACAAREAENACVCNGDIFDWLILALVRASRPTPVENYGLDEAMDMIKEQIQEFRSIPQHDAYRRDSSSDVKWPGIKIKAIPDDEKNRRYFRFSYEPGVVNHD
eukprot:1394468-Amorphochlora_amoeboformis.AAC.1